MSHPSTATRQRVPAHFAGNGRFLEVGPRIEVASNFLASFKLNRHMSSLADRKHRLDNEVLSIAMLVSPFLRRAKGPVTTAGSIQPHERGRRGDSLPILRSCSNFH